QAGDPGNPLRRQAFREVPGVDGERNLRAAGREAHPHPRQAADGEDAARVLPQRADEGDPEGAWRRGRQGRNVRAGEPHQGDKALGELKKLRQMSPMSAEATVVRNYLDWMLSIPWSRRSKIKKDLPGAQEILDNDHFGLDKVKERIIEYLAVQQRANKLTGPI